MSSIAEIEKAIEKLPAPQLEELATWLDRLRCTHAERPAIEAWLQRARGVAVPGQTTANLMALTRGEE